MTSPDMGLKSWRRPAILPASGPAFLLPPALCSRRTKEKHSTELYVRARTRFGRVHGPSLPPFFLDLSPSFVFTLAFPRPLSAKAPSPDSSPLLCARSRYRSGNMERTKSRAFALEMS